MGNCILFVTLLLAAAFPSDGTYWWTSWAFKWMTLLIFFAFWFGVQISRYAHWSLGIAFFWTVLSGILVFAGRGWIYAQQPITDLLAYKNASAYATLSFFGISVFYLIFHDKMKILEKAFVSLAWISLFATYAGFVYYYRLPDYYGGTRDLHESMGGIFGNTSENLCFLSLMSGFIKHRKKIIYGVILVLAIVLSKSLGPAVVLSATVVAFNLSREKKLSRFLALTGGVVVFVFGIYLYLMRQVSLTFHGRYEYWVEALTYWWTSPAISTLLPDGSIQPPLPKINPWLGSGLGTVQVFMPRISIQLHHWDMLPMWLHSGPIDILFQMGIVGFFAWGMVGIFATLKSWRDPVLFSGWIGYLVTTGANYPDHMAYQALFTGFLLCRIFRVKTDGKEIPEQPWTLATRGRPGP